ncbi:hypothetical protein FOA52_015657 [Chlamydomonas sp. UWO 241]|nr:hypothetical protein FOA52_015657 [Chlamydomonas sp. UWO 241]
MGEDAPPSAIAALIKASRPAFGCLGDKVAFAVHAVACASGLQLLATGDQVDSYDLACASGAEVEPDGWNKRQGEYAFLYACARHNSGQVNSSSATAAQAQVEREGAGDAGGASQAQKVLLVKCVVVGADTLCVTLLALGGGDTSSAAAAAAAAPPTTLELQLSRTAMPVSVSPDDRQALSPQAYGDLPGLVASMQGAMRAQLGGGAIKSKAAAQTTTSAAAAAAAAPGPRAGGSRLQEPVRGGRDPLLASYDDEDGGWAHPGMHPGMRPHPGGFMGGGPGGADRDPLMIGGPRRGGVMGGMGGPGGFGMPPGPFGPGGGGGMHVGPGDPLFADRLRHPGGIGSGRGGSMGGPGMGQRFDPIAPEGLQGWNPEDFQRGVPPPGQEGPPLHPDLAQPGPRRGTDYDNLFG